VNTLEQQAIDNESDAACQTDEEKLQMHTIKDLGLALHEYLDVLGSSRELSLAKTKIEEAIMWGVKHVTG
jgi:hypothetical protein